MRNFFIGLIFLFALSSSLGETTEVTCPAGQFYNDAAKTCENCPAGTSSEAGSSSLDKCLACKPGYIASVAGSSKCTHCNAGKYAVDRISCSDCPAGTTTYSGTSLDDCKVCPAGTVITEVLSSDKLCFPCGQDKYAVNGISCEQCPAGTFSKVENATSIEACQACPAGSYSGAPLIQGCRKCIAGQYEVDRKSCKWCPEGTISAEGSTSCSECPFGTTAFAKSECQKSFWMTPWPYLVGAVILLVRCKSKCFESRSGREDSERRREVNINLMDNSDQKKVEESL